MKSAASIFLLARLLLAPSGGAFCAGRGGGRARRLARRGRGGGRAAVLQALRARRGVSRNRRDGALDRRGVPPLRAPLLRDGEGLDLQACRAATLPISRDGAVAWFDEALDTPNLGPARGSGVLVRVEGRLEDRPLQPLRPDPQRSLEGVQGAHRGAGQVRLSALNRRLDAPGSPAGSPLLAPRPDAHSAG